MVLRFKLSPGDYMTHEIETRTVEEVTGSAAPWFNSGMSREHRRIFGVCPHCNNPVQLVGLFREQSVQRPHGKHVGGPIAGLAGFNPDSQRRCPHLTENRRSAGRTLPASEFDQTLLEVVRTEYDRIILLLRDFLGIGIKQPLARRMLHAWVEAEGYRFSRVHLRNLPWMIPYGVKAMNLYGQVIQSTELKDAISTAVPGVSFDKNSKLTRLPGADWFDLRLQCLHHSYQKGDAGEWQESLRVRVQDFSGTNSAMEAPTVWDEVRFFDPDRFEKLMATNSKHAYRDWKLLETAEEVLRGVDA